MKETLTYHSPHPSFKLDGKYCDRSALIQLGNRFLKEEEDSQVSLGVFILQWLDSTAEITLETSGSTGIPKSIVMRKQSMVNSALATGSYFKLSPGATALSCLPFTYIAAKMMFVRAYVLGLELDCVPPSSSPLASVSKFYDFCAMVPLQVEKSIPFLNQINTLIVGGAKLPAVLCEALKKSSSAVYETFGMTETVSHIAVKNLKKSAAVFEALPSISFELDAHNCLRIEAPQLLSSPLQTKDVVRLVSETRFEWLGRYDTLINSGGIKIHPEQLEQQLSNQIRERFFIGSVPDTKLGARIVLVVETKEPFTIKLDHIERHKQPKDVYFLEAFAETSSGKLKRKETLALLKPV